MRFVRTLILVFLPCCLNAQTISSVEHFDAENGLTENVVYSMIQDKQGFIWIGTHHGLNRFDGYTFKKFYHSSFDPFSLPDNSILEMEEMGDDIWLGTGKGMAVFSKKTFRCTSLAQPGKLSSEVFDIFKYNDSILLINIGYHPFILNCNTRQFKLITSRSREIPFIETGRFFKGPGAQIYLPDAGPKSRPGVISRFNLVTGHAEPVAISTILPFKPIEQVLFYYNDKKGNHWVRYNMGWRVYDKLGKLISLDYQKLNPFTGSPIVAVLEDDNDRLWLASEWGLYCYEHATAELSLMNDLSHKDLFPVNKIYSLLKDRNQNLWIGSFGGGVGKIRLPASPFKSIGRKQDYVLGGNMITGIRDIGKDQFLIHDFFNYEIRGADLQKIESGRQEISIEQTVRFCFSNKKDGLPLQLLAHLQKEKSLTIIGSQMDELGRFYSGGAIYNNRQQHFFNVPVPVSKIITDKWKRTWIATIGGLYLLSKTDSISIYKPENKMLSNESVNDLYYDGNNTLWLATGEGLNKLDLASMQVSYYFMKDGLPDNYLYQLQPDSAGNIWISTNRGLSCFSPNTNVFRNFSKRDGLINTEYNRASSCKLSNGVLVFAGTEGIDMFQPEEVLRDRREQPHVQLTSVSINNIDTLIENDYSVPGDLNNWSFSFTANNFNYPQGVFYRYWLRGASYDTTYLQGINTVSFSALRPGKYQFEVQSSYDKNNWSQPVVFPFHIRAPFYQTAWFYILAGLVLITGIYLLFRYRLRQQIKLLEMRNRISRDLHDEIGSSLSGINLLTQMADEKLQDNKTEEASSYLFKVKSYSQDVIEKLSDMVWVFNPENDSIEKLLQRLKSFTIIMAASKNIKVHFSAENENNKRELSIGERKAIYLISKEAINNAVKYSGCTNIYYSIGTEGSKWQLRVKDDGKGFIHDPENAGNGLKNMQARATEINGIIKISSGEQSGTTIQLEL